VAILLEVARQLSSNKPGLGIDIAFFDAEDWGAKNSAAQYEDSYALGTQYWTKNPHVANYTASYGILLDMTGARNATFMMEGNSMQSASSIVRKIWDTANHAGYSGYFIYNEGGFITDDHVYVIRIRNIPSVDIINTSPNGRFASHWHTHSDNMEVIDRNTLKAVGQTLLEVIFHENGI
jgi:Zn-dependent M28 family amino/carboxypeptidase